MRKDWVSVNALLGGGLIQFATGNDPSLAKLQLYRAQTYASSILES